MAEEFLSHFDALRDDGGDRGSVPPNDNSGMRFGEFSGDPGRVRMILIGSVEGVRLVIHQFHVDGVAGANDWSRLLPVPNSNEVMSILMLRPGQRNT